MTYRTRITLALSLVGLLGLMLLGGLFLYLGQRELLEDRISSGQRTSGYLARVIAEDMAHDALFQVFESLLQLTKAGSGDGAPAAVVLDRDAAVYATTVSPARDFLARPAAAMGMGIVALLSRVEDSAGTGFLIDERTLSVWAPVLWNGQRIGTLILRFSLDSLYHRMVRLTQLMAAYSLGVMAVLWFIGWLLGKRMVKPLTRLTETLRRVGQGDLDADCRLQDRSDEFAALGEGFEEMVAGLREKEALKKEIVESERMAAIGRVATGLAHEINNPLGGMLNAIDTYRAHGERRDLVGKTLDLVERGLRQLRDTVRALLVDAKLEVRNLSERDLEDLRTLVDPHARRKGVDMEWTCALPRPSGIPATQTRQVLINLLLNAVEATGGRGAVALRCRATVSEVVFEVEDTGPGIPESVRAHLFEPFVDGARGTGLGLWVSFQIITRLGGRISVSDRNPGTCFVVSLPRRQTEGGD